MKSRRFKFVALLLIAVLGGGYVWWLRTGGPPSITFVEFRRDQYGNGVAIFRAVNHSNRPYSFMGYGPTAPFHSVRERTAGGWKVHQGGFCGNGAGFHELAPHTSVDFEYNVYMASALAVGVHFVPLSQKEITGGQPDFYWYLRSLIQPTLRAREPTWSDTVEVPEEMKNPIRLKAAPARRMLPAE